MRLMKCTDGSILYPSLTGPVVYYPDGSRERLSLVYQRLEHEHDWYTERFGKACNLAGLPLMWVLRCTSCGQIKLEPVPYLLPLPQAQAGR